MSGGDQYLDILLYLSKVKEHMPAFLIIGIS